MTVKKETQLFFVFACLASWREEMYLEYDVIKPAWAAPTLQVYNTRGEAKITNYFNNYLCALASLR